MAEDPLYDYTDPSGKERIVRIIGRRGGPQFQTYMVDIEDVDTKEQFTNVPETELRQRPSE